MATYMVQLVYGDNETRRMEIRPAHREYCKALADRGILLAAGPFTDDSGAMLIYSAADTQELQEILDGDPYTEAEVVAETTVREWKPVTGSWIT